MRTNEHLRGADVSVLGLKKKTKKKNLTLHLVQCGLVVKMSNTPDVDTMYSSTQYPILVTVQSLIFTKLENEVLHISH